VRSGTASSEADTADPRSSTGVSDEEEGVTVPGIAEVAFNVVFEP